MKGENAINNYLIYLENSYDYIIKYLLDEYDKNLVKQFITNYINDRYYNILFIEEKDIYKYMLEKNTKLYNRLLTKKNKIIIYKIYMFFNLLIKIDNLILKNNITAILKEVDEYKFNYLDSEVGIYEKDYLINIFQTLIDNTNLYLNNFDTNEFFINKNNISESIYLVNIEHNVKVSKLYSEYAIDKAYNTNLIKEDRLFVLYNLLSIFLLKNIIYKKDYNSKYILEFTDTLLTKKVKIKRLLKIIRNNICNCLVSLKISYSDYLDNKDEVRKLIKSGINFSVLIDDEYDNNIDDLIFFKYILINKDSNYLSSINNNKNISSNIIEI